MATISFHVGTTTSISHNNRHHVSGNPDIDLKRIKDNIYYVQRDIREVYLENFDKAVEDYNAKQKRSDRKIDDYYSKILHDKKTNHQRELIVAIGSKDDDSQYSKLYYKDLKREILDNYMKGFQERNPNLKVYNAVMHLDEANPHLHINYVPVYEAKRGLTKRVGQDKALEQQGFKNFEEWRERETHVIEKEMEKYKLYRRFKDTGEHLGVKEYKTIKDDLKRLKTEKRDLSSEVYKLREAVRNYNEFEIPHKKGVLGEIKMSPKDFQEFNELVKSAKSYDISYYDLEKLEQKLEDKEREVSLRERDVEMRELSDAVRPHKLKAAQLEEQNERLLVENQELKKKVKEQDKELESKTSLLKDVYSMIQANFVLLNHIRENDEELKANKSLTAYFKTIKPETREYMTEIRAKVSKISYASARELVDDVMKKADRCSAKIQKAYFENLERLESKVKRVIKTKNHDRGMER